MDKLQPVKCGCGGEEHVVKYSVKDWDLNKWVPAFYVQCKKCGIKTIDYPTGAEAVQAWNLAMGDFSKTIIQKIDSVTPVKCEYGDEKVIFASGYICPNCYTHVIKKDKYCHECGMKLDWNNYV